MLSDQRNEKKDAPEADVRGTSAEAEQRPAQSERLSQLSESLPEWRIRRSGGGAERFVTLRRSRTEDAAEAVASEARRPWKRCLLVNRQLKSNGEK